VLTISTHRLLPLSEYVGVLIVLQRRQVTSFIWNTPSLFSIIGPTPTLHVISRALLSTLCSKLVMSYRKFVLALYNRLSTTQQSYASLKKLSYLSTKIDCANYTAIPYSSTSRWHIRAAQTVSAFALSLPLQLFRAALHQRAFSTCHNLLHSAVHVYW